MKNLLSLRNPESLGVDEIEAGFVAGSTGVF
ncbi:MAG: hypothetical protein CM15mP129_06590 [Chloroflexota bacterium]|nr:MAG: hypothetical protein CM15mP129_06590 [Chloroflexota bacterium]